MNRFQKWAFATTLATYILIMIGGMVRASDAGLGCPDWPQCFGRLYPPLTAEQVPDHIDAEAFDFQLAWIEYTNRLVGVVIGLLIIGTLYHAWKQHRDNPHIFYPTIGAFVFVLFEGWLGGKLVEHELQPWHITAHFVGAQIVVGLLLYATVAAFFPDTKPLSGARRTLAYMALAVLTLTMVQSALGTELRGQLEIIEKDMPDLARGQWIEEAGWVDPVHRSFSWLIVIGTAAMNYYVFRFMKDDHRLIHWTVRGVAALVLIQIVAGIGLAYGPLPPVLQVVHLISGSLLIGALVLIYLLVSRIPARATPNAANQHQHSSLSQQTA